MSVKPAVFGIVCEYNPFHSGHHALLAHARERGATHVVAVLGGNFVQRGEPACFEKGIRARAALLCGVDLVLELPLPWAVAGAETFALGGVFLLEQLGLVDKLLFGSECGSIAPLWQLAETLRSPAFSQALAHHLHTGLPFARARQAAVAELCGVSCASLVEQPNNILGIEYCKALQSLGSAIQPETMARRGAGYHDRHTESPYPSATALRHLLWEQPDRSLAPYMPPAAADVFERECRAGRLASPQRLETAILAHLRTRSADAFARLPDVSEGREHRLWHAVRQAGAPAELYAPVKPHRCSHARIRRMVLASFLGLTAHDTAQPPPYLRVLGMNAKGVELLRLAGQTARLPRVTKYADLRAQPDWANHVFALECRATDLYTLSFFRPQGCGLEQKRGIIKLDESETSKI